MNCTQGKQPLCLAAAWVGTLDSEIRLSKNTILFGGKMPLSGHLKEWRKCEAWRVETNHSCSWLWSLSDRWTEDEDCGSHSDDHTGDLMELKLCNWSSLIIGHLAFAFKAMNENSSYSCSIETDWTPKLIFIFIYLWYCEWPWLRLSTQFVCSDWRPETRNYLRN